MVTLYHRVAQYLRVLPRTKLCFGSELQFQAFYANIIDMLATKKKQAVIKKNQIHDKDTGSPEVQVAVLSTQIDALARHLKKHKKDNHSRRGLIKMVADRRTHLKYLERKSKPRYTALLKKMELA